MDFSMGIELVFDLDSKSVLLRASGLDACLVLHFYPELEQLRILVYLGKHLVDLLDMYLAP